MMKMGKKLLTFTLAAFTLTALSGCGKENRSSSETANTATEVSSDTTSEKSSDGNWHPDKPVTIKWATWEYNNTEGQEYLKKSLDCIKNISLILRWNMNTLITISIRRGCRHS